jgi:hypothetical protein
MKNKNYLNKIAIIFSIFLIIIALFNLASNFISIRELKQIISGYSVAYVNLTVNTNVAVSLTPAWGINWSNGSITSGFNNATLTTGRNTSSVSGGNWSNTNVTGILITNIGNVNATLTINGTKNKTNLFGVGASAPSAYQWNVTEVNPGTCSGGNPLSTWIEANHTAIVFCNQLGSVNGNNQVWFDVKLQVPYDTDYTDIPISDTLTISVTAAP